MNALIETFKKERLKRKNSCGFEILGFPSNQFGYQEPGENKSEIMNGLKYVRPGGGFVPGFPLFEKRDVNGEKQDEIYTFLKSRCPAPNGFIDDLKSIIWSPVRNDDINWNFEKVLIDHTGQPRARYSSPVEPGDLENRIRELLANCNGEEDRPSFHP